MKRALTLLLVILTLGTTWAADFPNRPNYTVHFSPREGCAEAVVDALSQARSTVLVQAYSFTSAPIAKALVDVYLRV